MVKGIDSDGQLSGSGAGDLVSDAMLRKEWLRRRKITGRDLAAAFGVTPSRVSEILGTGECPERHIVILRGLGMPENLLPKPSRERPGPPSLSGGLQAAS